MEAAAQPPSGGCVLKHGRAGLALAGNIQPPSGGCVLKQTGMISDGGTIPPAAFGRLCVETPMRSKRIHKRRPAAFGRLCVETTSSERIKSSSSNQPPSGGCVLKHSRFRIIFTIIPPAAFGRLCVETNLVQNIPDVSPPAAFGRLCVETKY